MRRLARAWPLVLLAVVVIAAWALGVRHLLAPGALGNWVRAGQALAAVHPLLAALAYFALYAALVAASVPIGLPLSVTGGALFGPVLGTVLAVLGATTGAILLFLVARGTVGGALSRRYGPLLARVRPRLERDGFAALLAMRLVPVVPFWLTNLAPALAGMRLLPYAVATLVGVVPATAVFVTAGAGLGDALAAGALPSPGLLLRPGVLLPLAGLALLALLPMAVRRVRRAKRAPKRAHG
jgi:uncharacterized membrane protein YdjX (TVP38/TMEM64 family)